MGSRHIVDVDGKCRAQPGRSALIFTRDIISEKMKIHSAGVEAVFRRQFLRDRMKHGRHGVQTVQMTLLPQINDRLDKTIGNVLPSDRGLYNEVAYLHYPRKPFVFLDRYVAGNLLSGILSQYGDIGWFR